MTHKPTLHDLREMKAQFSLMKIKMETIQRLHPEIAKHLDYSICNASDGYYNLDTAIKNIEKINDGK